MKYFTIDLIKRYNNFDDDDIQRKSESEWDAIARKYWEEFEKYKDAFPKSFLKEYLKHGFHDYELKSIDISIEKTRKNSSKEKAVVCISLYGGNKRKRAHRIKFRNVTHIISDLKFDNSFYLGYNLLYFELHKTDSEYRAEILFENGSELSLNFNKILSKVLLK